MSRVRFTQWNAVSRGALRALWRIPDGAAVRVVGDVFAPGVARTRLWDAMWARDAVTFVVETRRLREARAWCREAASVRHFDWCPNAPPMRHGELLDLDTLFYRNRCGWANGRAEVNNGYGCSHPEAKRSDEPGACFSWTCPIAYEEPLCGRCEETEDACKCADGFSESSAAMMELHTRPRDAMAANVRIGTRVTLADDVARVLHDLRLVPAAERFVRLAPGVTFDVQRWQRRHYPEGRRDSHEAEGRIGWVVRGSVWTPVTNPQRLPIVRAP